MIHNNRKVGFVFFLMLLFSRIEISAIEYLNTIYTPFKTTINRLSSIDIKSRTKDGFGAYRLAGHKHAGIDIVYSFNEQVYAIGIGVVYAVYGEYPYTTVMIKHSRNNGETIYSAYTHIQDVCVSVGKMVNEETCLGRAFNEEEYKKSEFYVNHIHFEIRRTDERYKGISIKCFSLDDLNNYFVDPIIFFMKEMKK